MFDIGGWEFLIIVIVAIVIILVLCVLKKPYRACVKDSEAGASSLPSSSFDQLGVGNDANESVEFSPSTLDVVPISEPVVRRNLPDEVLGVSLAVSPNPEQELAAMEMHVIKSEYHLVLMFAEVLSLCDDQKIVPLVQLNRQRESVFIRCSLFSN